jgi:hypothetical protein
MSRFSGSITGLAYKQARRIVARTLALLPDKDAPWKINGSTAIDQFIWNPCGADYPPAVAIDQVTAKAPDVVVEFQELGKASWDSGFSGFSGYSGYSGYSG